MGGFVHSGLSYNRVLFARRQLVDEIRGFRLPNRGIGAVRSL